MTLYTKIFEELIQFYLNFVQSDNKKEQLLTIEQSMEEYKNFNQE